MLLSDDQLIELLSKTVSTCGVLEVPQENDVKYSNTTMRELQDISQSIKLL